MPSQGQVVGPGGQRDTILAITPNHPHGKPVYIEAANVGGANNPAEAALIFGVTGVTASPDVVYNQSAASVIFPKAKVPSTMRIFVTSLWAQLMGNVAWTNTSGANPGILISDTSAYATPVAYIPQSALVPGVKIAFPESAITTPFIFGYGQTLTATYAASATANTSTLTISGNSVTTLYGNLYVRIFDDTTTPSNVGATAQIYSNTATVFTLVNQFVNSAGVAITPSSHAVYAIDYFAATSGSNTTAVIAAAANFAAHALQGSNIIMTQGTGAGQYSTISDNTTTTPTFATRNTAAASGTLFQLSSNPDNGGAIEFGITNGTMQLAYGAGLQASVVGVEAGGSNVRIGFTGYLSI